MPDRQTGRTSRMLADACARADDGERVLVIVATHAERTRLSKQAGNRPTLTFAVAGEPLLGQRFNRVVEDHYVDQYLRECRHALYEAITVPKQARR